MIDSTATGPATTPSFDVTELKRTFEDDGYLVLRGAISKTALQAMESQLAEAFRSWKQSSEAFAGGGLISGHLNCYPGHAAREVMAELRSSGVVALAQALVPTNPRAERVGCNFNLPGSVEQHYHMDGTFLQSFLIVNVAVVDTEIRNGAIDVIPRTHKRFYKYWEFALGRVNRGSQRICMSRGDVLIRLSTVWHRGMPNLTEAARPMLALTMGEKGVDSEDPLAANDVQFQTNWFQTSWLGRIRERTTVLAPITYSAYRFARSLVGNKGYAGF